MGVLQQAYPGMANIMVSWSLKTDYSELQFNIYVLLTTDMISSTLIIESGCSLMQILKEEIKDRIIQAAIDVFMNEGFKLASTRKIIKKAQISNGNLYNYFSSKEELFYAITTPFYHYFNNFLFQIVEHNDPEDFSTERIEILSTKIGNMIEEHRKEFIIIMNKSQGSKYENYKDDIIKIMTDHFEKNIKKKCVNTFPENFIMQILATNFIETLLEISKHFKSDNWAVENIRLFLMYHARGIAQFY
ncbi:MAG: TetR family transcriptional regulator [Firmicutes bacterium]|nr:TetR family transcriptional regulator [Bacillota bacterium]